MVETHKGLNLNKADHNKLPLELAGEIRTIQQNTTHYNIAVRTRGKQWGTHPGDELEKDSESGTGRV